MRRLFCCPCLFPLLLGKLLCQQVEKFGISKSTVHKDISERLPQFNRVLYQQVKEVLEVNKAQRHIRGGIATRKKYRGE